MASIIRLNGEEDLDFVTVQWTDSDGGKGKDVQLDQIIPQMFARKEAVPPTASDATSASAAVGVEVEVCFRKEIPKR
ncbi:kinesin-like protein Klp59C [Drosophila madeirensis]|uniref:Kinesin-like protein Klp59C n=1 Tax=Drosophila madeirensis TaxID=30013 RepID=A0AAU9FF03_DROMD